MPKPTSWDRPHYPNLAYLINGCFFNLQTRPIGPYPTISTLNPNRGPINKKKKGWIEAYTATQAKKEDVMFAQIQALHCGPNAKSVQIIGPLQAY